MPGAPGRLPARGERILAQDMKACRAEPWAGVAGRLMLFADGVQLGLHRHVVGVELAAEHDQVAGHAGTRPFAQGLSQYAQQAQALGRRGTHHDDRPVARKAQLPQHAPVLDLRQADGACAMRVQAGLQLGQGEHQRRAQKLQCRQVLGPGPVLQGILALRQGGGDHGGALHIAGLAVLVQDGHEGAGTVAGSRRKHHAHLSARAHAHAHTQHGDGIQAGVQRDSFTRCGLQARLRLAGRVIAAGPFRPIALVAQAQDLPLRAGHEMGHLHHLLLLVAGNPLKTHALLLRQPLRLHEHAGERRVGLVRARAGQDHLHGRYQLHVHGQVTQVVQHDLAQLDIVFRADPDRGAHTPLRPAGIEAHAVRVERAGVGRLRIGCRAAGHGHRGAVPVRSQVDKAPVRIAQQVIAPTRDVGVAQAAPSGSVGAQCNAVTPIAQQEGRLQGPGPRDDGADRVGRPSGLGMQKGCGQRAGPQACKLAGVRSCSSVDMAWMRGWSEPQRCATPCSSTLARATMVMPW